MPATEIKKRRPVGFCQSFNSRHYAPVMVAPARLPGYTKSAVTATNRHIIQSHSFTIPHAATPRRHECENIRRISL